MARTVIVAPGDTLGKIAEKYYGDPAMALKLARYNGLANPDLLHVGEKLALPARSELAGGKPAAVAAPAAQGGLAVAPPDGLDAIIKTFGDIASYIRDDGHLKPQWESEHMANAPIPFTIPLSWDRTKLVKNIYCHKLIVPVVADLFAKIDNTGLRSQVKTFGGCFNYRPKRQSSKLSTHCWGIAIDINPETNQQGSGGDLHPDLVALFRGAGFKWGGDWSGKSKDPMHFQFCTGY